MMPSRPTFPPSSKLLLRLQDFRHKTTIACGHWRLRHPISGNWIPRVFAACISMITGAIIVWQFPYQTANADLERLQRQAALLTAAYAKQSLNAPQTDRLHTAHRRAAQRRAILRQQLTAVGEQEAIMEEIDAAGRARGLQFTAFKPEHGKPALSVQLTALGTYRAITRFAGDLARLPRILTLDALTLQPAPAKGNAPDGMLTLQVTATAAAAGLDLLDTDAISIEKSTPGVSTAEPETGENYESKESNKSNEGDDSYKGKERNESREPDESTERDENAA